MLTTDDLTQIGKLIEPMNKRLDGIEQVQQEIKRDMVTKRDLQSAKQEINKTIAREATDIVEIIHSIHDYLYNVPEQITALKKQIEQLEKRVKALESQQPPKN